MYVIENNIEYITKSITIGKFIMNTYSFPSINKNMNAIIAESYFNLNGVQLIGETSYFFNYLHPYNYYNATPQIGLNVYSFCLRPTEFQPSGSCNMSRISYIGLKLRINNKKNDDFENLFVTDNVVNKDEYRFIFQTRNFNVLRIIGGIGATAYTY